MCFGWSWSVLLWMNVQNIEEKKTKRNELSVFVYLFFYSLIIYSSFSPYFFLDFYTQLKLERYWWSPSIPFYRVHIFVYTFYWNHYKSFLSMATNTNAVRSLSCTTLYAKTKIYDQTLHSIGLFSRHARKAIWRKDTQKKVLN